MPLLPSLCPTFYLSFIPCFLSLSCPLFPYSLFCFFFPPFFPALPLPMLPSLCPTFYLSFLSFIPCFVSPSLHHVLFFFPLCFAFSFHLFPSLFSPSLPPLCPTFHPFSLSLTFLPPFPVLSSPFLSSLFFDTLLHALLFHSRPSQPTLSPLSSLFVLPPLAPLPFPLLLPPSLPLWLQHASVFTSSNGPVNSALMYCLPKEWLRYPVEGEEGW